MGWNHNRVFSYTWVIIMVAMSLILGQEPCLAGSLAVLQKGLPHEILGWKAQPKDQIFDSRTIFDYIDGAAEVYRAYDMQYCLSRRYAKTGNPDIIMDIFDMGAPENAFGVFTHDQDGEELEIGQGALYRYGWLRFWKDRYFISIYPEEETSSSKRAVVELGNIVASLIKNEGSKPRILSLLPAKGLRPRSIRYFRDPAILNYHYYLADENILFLGDDTEAVLADYEREGQRSKVLIVLYPTREKALRAHESLLTSYLPEAGPNGIVRVETGMWAGSVSTGRTLIFVLEADSPSLAEYLLNEVGELARGQGQGERSHD
ncbi:MAG: hypothetical protein JRJ03_08320 [Deltaproteobacteria bacterium]|nr:hypothetical protein [Deltaproteobacteria bacterium]